MGFYYWNNVMSKWNLTKFDRYWEIGLTLIIYINYLDLNENWLRISYGNKINK